MAEILRQTEVGNILKENAVLDSPFFRVLSRTIRDLSGNVREQLIWDRRGKNFVTALAITEEGDFVMVKEPKYGQEKMMLTVPAGGIKKDETSEQAASRELFEETGYEVKSWIKVREDIVDFPDKTDGGQHTLFLGLGAQKVGNPENFSEIRLFNRDEFENLIDGQIEEAKLEIAISLVSATLVLRYLDKELLNTT